MSRFQMSSGWGSVALTRIAFALGLAALLLGVSGSARAASTSGTHRYQGGVVLVGFRPGVSHARIRQLERGVRARQLRPLIFTGSRTRAERALGRRLGASFVLAVPRGAERSAARILGREHRWVRYAEPNYILAPAEAGKSVNGQARAPQAMSAPATPQQCTPGPGPVPADAVVPDDAFFTCQWGSLNSGQTITGSTPYPSSGTTPGPITGTPGADDGASRAWKVSTGSRSIVIGELDSGIDYNDADLAPNIWSNPGNISNPDGSQCPAGTHGYDVISNSCSPMDDNVSYGGHGTHVAGIMGGVGDNGTGVAGMNWQTTILPVKAVDKNLYSSVATLDAGIGWFLHAKALGVNIRIVNYSPVQDGTANDPNLPALKDAINQLGQEGILFVTAAGGAVGPTGADYNGKDDDANPHYPCKFDLANEICVAASDQNGRIANWSNYGANSVDLAAPGDNILSTLRNDSYGYISGTSMAAPQVSGAAALILSVQDMSMSALKADILGNVDPLPAPYNAEVKSGGRLDVCAATPGCASPIQTTTNVQCTPTSVTVGQAATCTATIGDTDPSIIPPPRGTITFTTGSSSGSFAPAPSCTLSPAAGNSSSCSVTYTPSAVGSGTHTITASYGGDASHAASSGTAALTVGARAGGGGGGGGTGGGSGTGSGSGTRSGNPHLISTVPPSITGIARPGRVLTCHPGTWNDSPTAFTYRWERDGAAIRGARFARYRVRVADEASRLACVVTASNAAGSSATASSGRGVLVALRGTLSCRQPTGRLRGARLGTISLGMMRARARRTLRPFGPHHRLTDDLCLYGGWGIEVSYAHGRVVLASTSNPYYVVRGVRPGTSARVAHRRLKLHRGVRVGHSVWYVITGRRANIVLQVRHGIVQRIGIASHALTGTPAAQRRILKVQS